MANSMPRLPLQEPLVDRSGKVTQPWVGWLRELVLRVQVIDPKILAELQEEHAKDSSESEGT